MVNALAQFLHCNPANLHSIYIGSSDPGVAITDTKDLSAFTSGLSIVTNQTLYLLDDFNQGQTVPTSLYAPQVLFGLSPTNLQVNLTGQVAVVVTPCNPLSFRKVNGDLIASSNTTATRSLK